MTIGYVFWLNLVEKNSRKLKVLKRCYNLNCFNSNIVAIINSAKMQIDILKEARFCCHTCCIAREENYIINMIIIMIVWTFLSFVLNKCVFELISRKNKK